MKLKTISLILNFLTFILLEGCGQIQVSPTPTLSPTSTSTSLPIPTATTTPTPTPERLQFQSDKLVFPYDLNEVLQEIPEGAYRQFIYNYTHRLSNDPCGGHIGDTLSPLSIFPGTANYPGYNVETDNGIAAGMYLGFSYNVIQSYSGIVTKMWITEGRDLGITFFVGEREGMDYYLSMFHHNRYANPDLKVGDFVPAGDVIGYLERADNYNFDNPYNPYIEGFVHLVLEFVRSGSPPPDFIDANPKTSLDISLLLLPETIWQTTAVDLPLLVRYNGGHNYCNMTDNEAAIAAKILLTNAGFCLSDNLAAYCGTNSRYHGLQVSITAEDYRTIELNSTK
jgi:hypothetical protein